VRPYQAAQSRQQCAIADGPDIWGFANRSHLLTDAGHRCVRLGVPDSALEPVRRDRRTTLAGGIFSVSRSSAFSAVIWLMTRTSAGTSEHSRVGSLSLFATVFFSLAICSRSRTSTSGFPRVPSPARRTRCGGLCAAM
jgi:hypothetical protein